MVKEKNDPVFNALLNSNLICHDCIFKGKHDYDVVACIVYPNDKPGSILDGGPCSQKMTVEEAVAQYEAQNKQD